VVSTDREVAPLAKGDSGREAWLFLIAGTVIETTVWGLLNAVGVLEHYWAEEQFPGHHDTVTVASSLMNGLSYLGVGFFGPLLTSFPQWSKGVQILGLVVSTAGLIGAAFVTSPTQLIGTIGVLFPFSAALYLPCATLVYEWFYEKRGLATGIMFAGTGVGGTVFPFLLDGLLKRFGYKATMISFGVGYAALNAVSLIFIRRRVPLGGSVVRRRPKVEWRHLATWTFVCGFLVILLSSLGNFTPTLWIPTFADKVGAHKPGGVALVAIMNAASVPGNLVMGWVSDRLPTKVMIMIVCFGGAIGVLLPWGFGTTSGPLVVFALVWGSTALSMPGIWSRIITPICRNDPTLPGLVFSIFASLRGVGNVTAGPISSKLLKVDAFKGAAGAYGTNFGAVLVYTAVTTFAGGVFGAVFPA
jgi:MFS family permease